MTITKFETLCGELLIDPALALENEEVRDALARRDDDQVEDLLKTEF